MVAELRRRALEHREQTDNDAPLDEASLTEAIIEYVEAWTAEGKTILDLAASIAGATGTHIMRESLSKYLHSLGGDGEIEARLIRARARGGHALAEKTVEIADAATPKDVQVAALRVKSRQWLAERWNRAELGQQAPSVNVAISLGQQHLDALRARQAGVARMLPPSEPAALPAAEVIDAQLETPSDAVAQVVAVQEDSAGRDG